MAQVPSSGSVSVAPASQVNISAPADAFTASTIGAGLQQTAAAVQQRADVLEQHAMQFQALNNKAASDDAYVKQLQQANQYATDFMANNRGIAAFDNLPKAMTDLEEGRSAIEGTLQSPMARQMFNSDSRRALSNITGELARYAGSQRKDYLVNTSNGKIAALQADTAVHPDRFMENLDTMTTELAYQSSPAVMGWSPEQFHAAVQENAAKAVGNVVETMVNNNQAEAAKSFLENHKDLAGESYGKLLGYINRAAMPQEAVNLADQVFNHYAGGAASSPHGAAVSPVPATAVPTGHFGDQRAATADTPAHIHAGEDFAVPIGTPIAAPFQGRVVSVGPQQGYGLSAIIDYGHGLMGLSGHLSASELHAGDVVQPGARVGASGRSGNATGPSVHIEFRQVPPGATYFQGTPVDPKKVLAGGPDTGSIPQDQVERMNSAYPAMLQAVDSEIDRRFPGQDNAGRKAMAEARLESQASRWRTAQTAATSATFDQALSLVMGSESGAPITDLGTFKAQYPQIWSGLSSTQQRQIERYTIQQKNERTPNRLQSDMLLEGMWKMSPEQFAKQDLTKFDLTPNDMLKWNGRQQALAARINHDTMIDGQLSRAMRLPLIATALKNRNINQTDEPGEYEQFAGALSGQIAHFVTVHARQPNDSDLYSMSMELLAGKARTMEIPFTGIEWQDRGNEPSYHVPDTFINQVKQEAKTAGRPEPSAGQIAEFYFRSGRYGR